MSFTPIVPSSGIAGLTFLKRTRDDQQAVFEAQPRLARSTAGFEEKIANIRTAQDLVSDRGLLEVALGAFGLDADINSKFLIEQVLSSDPEDPASLVSRFSDKRYKAFSTAFGFGAQDGPRTGDAGFAEKITDLYKNRQFEIAVGEVDTDMRLALGFARDLQELTSKDQSNNSSWFNIMSNPPLRTVFEKALGLPSSFGAIDLDQQLGVLKDRSERIFGSSDLKTLAEPETMDEIVRTFLVRSQVDDMLQSQLSGAGVALSLLQSAPRLNGF